MILLLKTKLGSAVPLTVFAMFGVFLLIRPVYKEDWQKVRAFCNFAVCVCIEAIYLSYSLVDPNERQNSKIFFYLPLIVCGLLIICVVYNLVALVYRICKGGDEKNLS